MNERRPIIGVVASRTRQIDKRFGEKMITYVNSCYIEAITKNSGVPLLIPFSERSYDGIKLLELCQGVIFPGGTDVNPMLFHEEPSEKLGPVDPEVDEFLYDLMGHCIETKKPMLTICKGMQLLNIMLGGTLYQDLSCRQDQSISHLQYIDRSFAFHKVQLEVGSKLHQIFKEEFIHTNSLHHQAIRKLAPSLQKTGWTADGLIEAVESKDAPFIGVQWHPEDMIKNPKNENMNCLFEHFILKLTEEIER